MKVKLPVTGYYTPKDQEKSDKANKFIGRGSNRSSTNQYMIAWGANANCGNYNQEDVVWISAEGNRRGSLEPDYTEIGKAVDAGVTFVTDIPSARHRPYNTGERKIEAFLKSKGYKETQPGIWTKH